MTRLVNVSGASVLARGITKKRVNNEGKIIDNVIHSHPLFFMPPASARDAHVPYASRTRLTAE